MNANKLFSEFSLQKIWDKLLKHDKAMNSTLLILAKENWGKQEDGTFRNIITYDTFRETDKLTVDLYDDGNLSNIILTEYEEYIDEFKIINGALVATANTKPTQTMTIVVKGDFETIADIGNLQELSGQVSELSEQFPELSGKVDELSKKVPELSERVNSCFQSVSEGKALLASVLTDKGVETSQDATFETIANSINNIATATCRYLITYGRANNIAESVQSGANYDEYLQITNASRITVLKDCTLVIASMGDWEYSIQLTSNGSTKTVLCCEWSATNEVCQVNNGLFSNAIVAKAGDYITAPNIYGNYKYVLITIF